jgi:HEPN domain-containing protein
MNGNKNEKVFLEWIEKADEDLLSLKSLIKHKEGSPSTGCFLAQQAVEKLLKALIIKHDIRLEKIHDLITLSNKVKKLEPQIDQFLEEIAILTRYYIETRYPWDYPEFSWQECEGALEIANKIREFTQSKI